MAKRKASKKIVSSMQDNPPAGATRAAFDREPNGGERHPSGLGDRHAQGTPGGGGDDGGLAGSDYGDGTPLEQPLAEDEPGYGGPAGGAVGGTPAGGRATGGHVYKHTTTPSPTHRGDSTIGAPSEE